MNPVIAARLATAGVELSEPSAPRYSYVAFTVSGEIAYFSGKTSIVPGSLLSVTGKAGRDVTPAQAGDAARLCAINLMSAVEFAVGLERVRSILKLTGFVASVPEFSEQAAVVDHASRLLVNVLGEAGHHARTAIGVAVLPGNATVELDAVIQLTEHEEERA
ncbi:RidA family protein [Nostocoides sp. HKS02]|uniref:RidA family protein n=1 Tax=Nostocoides sp. HKS02 TaxID=1813880 RepID=UPI0012B4E6BF|nr:RidA family protein [Tetrasphaera sp. HKS02]QGN58804.1 RidA family protein [Tetrasphaera sp. HKS02]